ncbi:hypothetical protein [Sphingomonas bacterium]|uniref:hypothetical protein n=1 Tax=Sphingomonas bacterium TaxID=1895847 RepID=UPI001576D2F6|nr:hypothetical protein [Sphingomonas bacterium]
MDAWQSRLLPVMVAMLVGAALLFSTATIVQYGRIAQWMTAPTPPPSGAMWDDAMLRPATFADRAMLAQRRAEYALEVDVIRRRYEQNGQAITTRLWARFMGFLTGMIMTMVGSAFVLGKLNDAGNELSGGGAGYALAIKSASPGIVLATLGTVLIGMSLWVEVTVNVHDAPVYFHGVVPDAPPPAPLDSDALNAAMGKSSTVDAVLANMTAAS